MACEDCKHPRQWMAQYWEMLHGRTPIGPGYDSFRDRREEVRSSMRRLNELLERCPCAA